MLRRVECWAFQGSGWESDKEFLNKERKKEQRMGRKG